MRCRAACLPAHGAAEPSTQRALAPTPHLFTFFAPLPACSYMEDGRIAFSGSPAEARAYLRRLGATGV